MVELSGELQGKDKEDIVTKTRKTGVLSRKNIVSVVIATGFNKIKGNYGWYFFYQYLTKNSLQQKYCSFLNS